ncbi:hypothetical protein ES965_14435 [Bacillus subtilis]|uniref:hypothetical protein n=1 Tax=Bacillus subtilis TaxID=1423 RepID=UPI00100A052A|nr:hypothetical protein [Bacillus subtilis]QAV85206.1 hypothetical protein ES965_14435 [Bacillus subtilis]
MAKLEGVKTLDMVNGEITKVEYGGAEYVKTDSPVQEGDIFLLTEGHLVIGGDTGAFYMANKRPGGGIEIPTMYRGNASAVQKNGNGIAFRKVDAATNPSVEERVAKAEGEIESLKSDVAVLKGEAEYKRIAKSEARAGDYVKFDYPPSFLTAKEYYEIKEFEDGDPVIIDDDGDEYDTYSDDFEVYRKAGADDPKPERLKVGDYAKVVNATDYHSFRDGDIVEIVEDPFTGPINECARKITGGVTQYVPKRQLVRATDEEVAEAKRVAAEAAERKKWAEIGREVGEYKVGDIFRSPNGNLYEINRIDDRLGYPIGFKDSEGFADGYKRDAAITLVTPVEARFDR